MLRSAVLPAFFYVALLLQEPEVVQANLFSRALKFDNSGSPTDVKQAVPSGARSASTSEGQAGSVVSFADGVLMTQLSNNKRIPLVGVGVGHTPHKFTGAIVAEAIQDETRVRLIDTSHASQNEDLIAEGLLSGADELGPDGKIEVHVITKVWYTHLGYQRTKLSVEDSFRAFEDVRKNDKIDLRFHLLINWPRCYDNVAWMNCESEEEQLPAFVKDAGPDPTKYPDAWKDSWKYLEDIYLSGQYPIESIGVANFHLDELEAMDNFARIHPQVVQMDLWSLIYDSMLINYCHQHQIHVQVYNALHGTVARPGMAPHAYHHIQMIANELSAQAGLPVTPGQTVLAWLIQHGISVVPGARKLARLEENSSIVVSSIPALNDQQIETVAHAVEAFMSGNDMDKDVYVSVTFHAMNQDLMLYWVGKDGSETRIDHIRKGDTFEESTYPNHTFRTYNAYNKDIFVEHKIDANFGEHKNIYVEI